MLRFDHILQPTRGKDLNKKNYLLFFYIITFFFQFSRIIRVDSFAKFIIANMSQVTIKDELRSKDVTQITQDYGGMVRFPSGSGISLNAIWMVYFKDNQVYFLTLAHPASSFSGPTGSSEVLKDWLVKSGGFQRHENNLYIKPRVIVNAQIVPQGIQYQENGRAQQIIEV
jgi:hypothetical protein